MISTRLRELEEAGIVHRRHLDPPEGTRVYELTDRGRGLEPVLLELGRWGSRTPMTSTTEPGVDALIIALKTTFDAATAGRLRAVYTLRLNDDHFDVTVTDGHLEVSRATTRAASPDGNTVDGIAPDAVIDTDPSTLRSVIFGRRSLGDAVRAGDVRLGGTLRAANRFVGLFAAPTPDTPTSTPAQPATSV